MIRYRSLRLELSRVCFTEVSSSDLFGSEFGFGSEFRVARGWVVLANWLPMCHIWPQNIGANCFFSKIACILYTKELITSYQTLIRVDRRTSVS